jgi:hypothetical protein
MRSSSSTPGAPGPFGSLAAAFVLATAGLGCDPDLPAKPDAAEPFDAGRPDARVDASTPDASRDASASDAPAEAAADSGPLPHLIDGVNDFAPGEALATSSITPNLYRAFIAWDAANVYFGFEGIDLGPGASASKFVLVYLDGASGTTTGLRYNTQQPTLPFPARYHLRYKTDKTYTNAQEWTGAAWTDATVSVPITAASSGSFVEMSIARSAIGSPSRLKVHMSMINEATGAEWTYAGVPSTSFTDGPNRSYTKYFDFDLGSPQAPNLYAPLP